MTQRDNAEIAYLHITGEFLDRFLAQPTAFLASENQLDAESEADGIAHFARAFRANLNPRPLLSILRIARNRYRCFALVETPYFDLDEWDGYAAFYSRSFTPFRRFCSRVHLVEGDEQYVPKLISRLKAGIDQKDHPQWLDDLDMKYRGFFVLRPHRSCVIGRTVIAFDDFFNRTAQQLSKVELHELEETGQPFCTASITNKFHLSSLSMSIETVPSIQQDPVVGVCATAAVWVASQVLSGRFGLHKHPYSTITRQALKYDHEEVATGSNDWKLGPGYSLLGVKQALSRTGCVPFLFGPSDVPPYASQARMRFLAYTFVESGLPIVAAYSGHAVTIVGHLLPGRKDGGDAAEAAAELICPPVSGKPEILPDRHLLLGQAVQLYYAHNDAYGPFDRFRLFTDDEAETCRKQEEKENPDSAAAKPGACFIATWRKKNMANQREERFGLLQGFAVPLPPYVQNHDPICIVIDAMRRFDGQFPLRPETKGTKVLWRCFLASAPDFKQSVVRRKYSSRLRQRYMEMHLPLFVWVVEFTILSPNSHVPYAAPRPIDGEFLYDSTTPFYDPRCISFRARNVLRDFRTDSSLRLCGEGTDIEIDCFVPVKTRR